MVRKLRLAIGAERRNRIIISVVLRSGDLVLNGYLSDPYGILKPKKGQDIRNMSNSGNMTIKKASGTAVSNTGTCN